MFAYRKSRVDQIQQSVVTDSRNAMIAVYPDGGTVASKRQDPREVRL
jgi:hypothetical protein